MKIINKFEFKLLVELNTFAFKYVKGKRKNLIKELLFADDTALSFNTENGLETAFLEGM